MRCDGASAIDCRHSYVSRMFTNPWEDTPDRMPTSRAVDGYRACSQNLRYSIFENSTHKLMNALYRVGCAVDPKFRLRSDHRLDILP